jgi:hypothetical protein
MGPFCSREALFSHPFTHERAHISRALVRSCKLLHVPLMNASGSRVQCAYKNLSVAISGRNVIEMRASTTDL